MKDPIKELIESAKAHPLETFALYDIFTPAERKKEIEERAILWIIIFAIIRLFDREL